MGYFEDRLAAASEAQRREAGMRAERERALRAEYEQLVAEFIEVARKRQVPTVQVKGFPGHTEAWLVPWYSGDGYTDAPRLVFSDGTVCAGRNVTIRRRFLGDRKEWSIYEHSINEDYSSDLGKLKEQLLKALL